jgi:hypothetical protein
MRILVVEGDSNQTNLTVRSVDSLDRLDSDTLAISINVTAETAVWLLLSAKDIYSLRARLLEPLPEQSEVFLKKEDFEEEFFLAGGE